MCLHRTPSRSLHVLTCIAQISPVYLIAKSWFMLELRLLIIGALA